MITRSDRGTRWVVVQMVLLGALAGTQSFPRPNVWRIPQLREHGEQNVRGQAAGLEERFHFLEHPALLLLLDRICISSTGELKRPLVCVYYCSTYYKAVREGGGGDGGHVLRETTSRGRCELVCPSRTNERGGEEYCVKEGGGEEGHCPRSN